MCDRIFVKFADGSWVTTDNSTFQADLAEMVAKSGQPVLVEFRAAKEGYAAPTSCEDCGLSWAQCHCDDLLDDDRSAAEKGTWSAIDSWNAN